MTPIIGDASKSHTSQVHGCSKISLNNMPLQRGTEAFISIMSHLCRVSLANEQILGLSICDYVILN